MLDALAALGALAILLPLIGLVIGGSRATALAVLGIGGLVAMLVADRGGRHRLRRAAPALCEAIAELARWVGSAAPADRERSAVVGRARARPRRARARRRPSSSMRSSNRPRCGSTGSIRASLLPPRDVPRRAQLGARRARPSIALLAGRARRCRAAGGTCIAAPPDPFDGARAVGGAARRRSRRDADVPRVQQAQAARAAVVVGRSARAAGHDGGAAGARARRRRRASSLDRRSRHGAAPKTIAAKLDGDQLSAELTIDDAARYRFAVTSADRRRARSRRRRARSRPSPIKRRPSS